MEKPRKVGIFKRSGFANLGFGAGAMRVIIKSLRHHGIPIGKIIGSSGGSFAVPAESLGLFNDVLTAWFNLTPDKIAKSRPIDTEKLKKKLTAFFMLAIFEPRLIPQICKALVHSLNPLEQESILDPAPLREYSAQYIEPCADRAFSGEAIPFEIITTNLETGHGVYFDNEPENKKHALDICMASAAIVPFLLPVKIGNLFLVDGAYSDDMPIKRFAEAGCDLVLVVDIYNGLPVLDIVFREFHWPDLIMRTLLISVQQHSRLRLALNRRINTEVEIFDQLEEISGGDNSQLGQAAKRIIQAGREKLRIDHCSTCRVVMISPFTPIDHIGFRKFDDKTKRELVECGYWWAKVAMKKLGFNYDGV